MSFFSRYIEDIRITLHMYQFHFKKICFLAFIVTEVLCKMHKLFRDACQFSIDYYTASWITNVQNETYATQILVKTIQYIRMQPKITYADENRWRFKYKGLSSYKTCCLGVLNLVLFSRCPSQSPCTLRALLSKCASSIRTTTCRCSW